MILYMSCVIKEILQVAGKDLRKLSPAIFKGIIYGKNNSIKFSDMRKSGITFCNYLTRVHNQARQLFRYYRHLREFFPRVSVFLKGKKSVRQQESVWEF